MADSDNGNSSSRGFASMDEDKQKEIASKGGKASTGSFGDKNGADPHEAGKKGAQAQPVEAKRKGGQNSHGGGNSNSGSNSGGSSTSSSDDDE